MTNIAGVYILDGSLHGTPQELLQIWDNKIEHSKNAPFQKVKFTEPTHQPLNPAMKTCNVM